jgi:Tol biopolymer transport system component
VRRAAALLLLPIAVAGLAGCGSSGHGAAQLVFASTRDGDYALFGLDAKGREWRLAPERGDPGTPTGLFFELQPAWSPDGATIAFASTRDGKRDLYRVRPDGTRLERLTAGASVT